MDVGGTILTSLLRMAQALQHRKAAVNLLLDQSLDNQKFELAAREFSKAMEFMPEVVDNPEVMFWYAITLRSLGIGQADPVES